MKTKSSKENCKVFINVCQSDMVAKATATPSQKSNGKGDQWSIPYSLTTVKDDVDHGNKRERTCSFYSQEEIFANFEEIVKK